MDIRQISPEKIFGLIGGGLFLGSWLLQAWETRKAGESIVSFNFFLLRLLGSLLLLFEATRVKSLSLSCVQGGTVFLTLYNMYMIRRKRRM
ncbi:hypothetical protein CSB45_04825 [candidate division KSB3 bacterium]|uniref:Lipid A biosynthesis N-terminal domain-containing protein n=1 Tax=candidate division KSB3 bacterium TaxID=2044937 RepID=A0A2G6E7F1_9BACT|nr:MAG: hypothetical protein CSB45_04825 [candidate division KSB3 bacterium]PIE30380.1 MAG: hypothetical protein CSA57_03595 [candidate division KSB3 bacterium]